MWQRIGLEIIDVRLLLADGSADVYSDDVFAERAVATYVETTSAGSVLDMRARASTRSAAQGVTRHLTSMIAGQKPIIHGQGSNTR